jgi:hypothetical protein
MEAEKEGGTEEQSQYAPSTADGVYGTPWGELTGRTEINGGEGLGTIVILKYISRSYPR